MKTTADIFTFNWELTDSQISDEMDSFIDSNFSNGTLVEGYEICKPDVNN